ncbi:PREDICTED: PHD finger protein 14-like [Priapulus caudatus]|uniref:PHD finger protein 14-like n=1 Tax=Priapulus caudatus TaxID=37621 RepID=A0ABM1E9W5_PRICU|nr:PREDICTED: PHD finger protein 14-like [Priapulus caudatus]
MASADLPNDVSVFLHSMYNRDPKKRKVKPVESHLLQVNFGGLDDSEEDSDFDCNLKESSDDEDDKDDSDRESKEVEDEESEEGKVAEEEDDDITSGSSTMKDISISELLEKAKERQQHARVRIASGEARGGTHLDVRICAVCLGDISEPSDEIVECDRCGVSVHEGCYGISDADSEASTASSSSTEPWFCDACRAGATNPSCELCPNLGGLFKETDTRKWVHLVCALYVQGIAFGDVDKLTRITLYEMPYSRFGQRECGLCEDEKLNRCGVCIRCDAGMCRNYFHVTCAQRHGLLSEALPYEEIADPFYAYCKLHADRSITASKRRNWLALRSQTKKRTLREKLEDMTTPEQKRFHRKLHRASEKYKKYTTTWPPCWIPTQKLPRLLTTCPSAFRRLLKKAELLGIDSESSQLQQVRDDQLIDIKKKWHIAPSFTAQFVNYYYDRNERINSMRKRQVELIVQNESLLDQQRSLMSQYHQVKGEFDKQKEANTKLRDDGDRWHLIMCALAGKTLEVPSVLKVVRSPKVEKRAVAPPAVLMHKCAECGKNNNQHQMAQCDTCLKYYHLGCLDPPLTRMPKKTKLYGWQCMVCCPSSSSDDDHTPKVDPNAPRQLRQNIKEPSKFTPPHLYTNKTLILRLDQEDGKLHVKKPPKKRRAKKKLIEGVGEETVGKVAAAKRKVETVELNESGEMQTMLDETAELNDESMESHDSKLTGDGGESCSRQQRPKRRRMSFGQRTPRDVRVMCDKCGGAGSNSNLVRCDDAASKCLPLSTCLGSSYQKESKRVQGLLVGF